MSSKPRYGREKDQGTNNLAFAFQHRETGLWSHEHGKFINMECCDMIGWWVRKSITTTMWYVVYVGFSWGFLGMHMYAYMYNFF